jgi:hypothetical protein
MSLVVKEKINKRCENSALLRVKVSEVNLIYFINPNNNEIMKMDNLKKRRKCLVIFLIIIILSIIGTVFIGFFACNDEICAFSTTKKLLLDHHHAHQFHQQHQSPSSSQLSHHQNQNIVSNFFNISTSSNSHKHKLDSHLLGLSYDEVLNDDFQSKFDINKFDVMVRNEM